MSRFIETIGGICNTLKENRDINSVQISLERKDLEGFIDWSISNGIFCRVYPLISDHVKSNSINHLSKFNAYVGAQKERRVDYFKTIQILSETCAKNDINYVVIKSLDKYPDLGKDIDIIVAKEDYSRFKSLLRRHRFFKRESIYLMLFGRELFKNTSLLTEIDLYQRFSRFHERWLSDDHDIFQNNREKEINGHKMPIPSPEITILLNIIASVYLNGMINISGILVIYAELVSEHFNCDRFISLVERSGISHGVLLVLNMVNAITGDTRVETLYDNIAKNVSIKQQIKSGEVLGDLNFPYTLPRKVIAGLYYEKFLNGIGKGDMHSVFLIIPLSVLLLNIRSR